MLLLQTDEFLLESAKYNVKPGITPLIQQRQRILPTETRLVVVVQHRGFPGRRELNLALEPGENIERVLSSAKLTHKLSFDTALFTTSEVRHVDEVLVEPACFISDSFYADIGCNCAERSTWRKSCYRYGVFVDLHDSVKNERTIPFTFPIRCYYLPRIPQVTVRRKVGDEIRCKVVCLFVQVVLITVLESDKLPCRKAKILERDRRSLRLKSTRNSQHRETQRMWDGRCKVGGFNTFLRFTRNCPKT